MRLIAIPAALGFIVSLVIHLGTFFGHPAGKMSGWLETLMFALLIATVVVSQRRGENTRAVFDERVPRWAQLFAKVTAAYVVLNFALFFVRNLDGSPEHEPDGRYTISSHGRVVQTITEEEFVQRKALVTRGFSGHWMLFYLAPALYFGFVYRPKEPPAV